MAKNHIFGILRYYTLMLCIWFPWERGVLNLKLLSPCVYEDTAVSRTLSRVLETAPSRGNSPNLSQPNPGSPPDGSPCTVLYCYSAKSLIGWIFSSPKSHAITDLYCMFSESSPYLLEQHCPSIAPQPGNSQKKIYKTLEQVAAPPTVVLDNE